MLFFKEYDRLLFIFFYFDFFTMYNVRKFKFWRRKHNYRYRKLFRLKKELNYTAIKYIRNFLRLEKETKANAYRY